MSNWSELERTAHDLGALHARNAASWVTDGNKPMEHYRAALDAMEDGDDIVDQWLPARPNLSGEWAQSMTPTALYDYLGMPNPTDTLGELLCAAYEEGVNATFDDECERLMRAALEA